MHDPQEAKESLYKASNRGERAITDFKNRKKNSINTLLSITLYRTDKLSAVKMVNVKPQKIDKEQKELDGSCKGKFFIGYNIKHYNKKT